jgi:hypothetical protein
MYVKILRAVEAAGLLLAPASSAPLLADTIEAALMRAYAVLNAVGRLSPQVLNLSTTVYDPSVQYHQVRDAGIGVRAPDGR